MIIVTNVLMSKAIKIIELVLAPTQMIINGPKATLGKEFNIVKYGSTTLAIVLLLQRIVAMINPRMVAIEKLMKTSYSVTPI